MSPIAIENDEGEPTAETALATIRLRPDGLVHVVLKRGAHASDESVRDAVHAIEDIAAPEVPCRVVVDIRRRHSSDASARRYSAGPELAAVIDRLALLIGSPVSRMLARAFLAAGKPAVTTRIFSSEEDAVEWLKEA